VPFDGTHFPDRPRQPRRATRDDDVVTFIIVALAICLLVTPISLAALVDIVRALHGK
jgi:hypothetical protein